MAMTVTHSVDQVEHAANSIVTVGTFDGVHRGHQAIIREVVHRGSTSGARTVVITFDPHPREIVGRGPVKLLSTLEERIALISFLGIDLTLVLPFTYEFSRQSSRAFYERYVVQQVGVREVVEGDDHMFGRDREANIDTLRHLGKDYGFSVVAAAPVTVDGEAVSSSKIREALMRGDVERAEKYLDRPYSISGIVVRGDGRGELLGFPTANLKPDSEKKVIPAEGVYFVSVEYVGQQRYGMLNIGVRPTFSTTLDRVIETHIFNVNENLYDKKLTIHFHRRLRQEKKFSSKEELVTQLRIDRDQCMKYIGAVQPVQNTH